jgi:ParB-like chromosome segregation protein Spo0J
MTADLKFHPLADLFPLMEGTEFDALVADIRANGLLKPIAVFDGMILDGRNRFRACKAAGVHLVTDDIDGWIDDPAAYVISANIRRRHLNAKQKRDVVAKLIKAAPEKSNRQIARTAKVDHKTVGAIRAEKESTGEIPQLNKTVGVDGKARRAERRRKARECEAKERREHEAEREAAAAEWRTELAAKQAEAKLISPH